MGTGGAGERPTRGWDQQSQFFGGPAHPAEQFGQPGAGWPQMAGRRTNSLAIAALCCGIAQVVAGPFAAIPAIVLGAMSLRQIRLSGEDGRGMAVTDLVLGVVGTILSVLVVIVAVLIINRVASGPAYP